VLKALVERGGVIGCTTYPPLLGGTHLTLTDWCTMMARLADLIGADHLGLGTDTSLGWNDDDLLAMNVARWSHEENWGSNLPGQSGWTDLYPWYRSSADMPKLTEGLLAIGFSREEVAGIMGANWLRLLATVIG
jgi:microsomal dipeptidase-like Zn-dependent dipeptidase